ncbi:MAG: LPP20 family lipoprotein [Marinobacterium sp.]|nr:LPP20 family lipoprotein [Marinobacterium sp.]
MRLIILIRLAVLAAVLALTGCETMTESMKEVAASIPAPAEKLVQQQPQQPRWVRATGYAPVSLQAGKTREHKMIVAMRASKLRAYQELAAIVHGQYLFGTSTVKDMIIESDQFKTAVSGIVRGARVVKTFPIQNDTYATTLEVDMNQVQRAWLEHQPKSGG